MTDQHHHCRECDRVMEDGGRLQWRPTTGTAGVTVCPACRLLRVEHEHAVFPHKKVKWVQL